MNKKASNKELRKFGFIFGFGLPIFVGFLIPALGGHTFKLWTLLLAIPTLLISVFKVSLLSIPYKIWMKIGYFLGYINSRIILGLIFILLLIPISSIMKLFNYDPLKRKFTKSTSYKINKTNNENDLKRIF